MSKVIILILAIIIVGGLGYWIYQSMTVPEEPPEGLTVKEQVCIDAGGTVSTSLCCKSSDDFPNLCLIGPCGCSPENSHQVKICECGPDRCFDGNQCIPAKLTNGDETADWEIYRNEEGRYEFRYPKDFNQKYIKEHDWPPRITVRLFDPNFFCENLERVKTPIGYGKQQEVVLNGSKYCVLIVSEGTAGTSYITYNYVTEKNDKHLTLEFILKFPSCGAQYGINNKMDECEETRENCDEINIVDQIISTFRFLD